MVGLSIAFRREDAVIPILVALLVAAGVSYGCWLLDVRLTRTRFTVRSQHALLLIGTTAWLVTLILLEPWFLDSTVYGSALFWFRMRVVALFLMFGCLGLAISVVIFTIAGVLASRPLPKWRLCVVPAIALVLFAVACCLVGARHFLPTA